MQISSVDFNSMMAELFEYDTPKFDSMCKIARDQLTPLVTKWCVTNPSLRDKGLEDEIIQKTSVRLIRYSLDKFFFAGGREEPNNDPEQFCKWMCAIAKNVAKDEIKSLKSKRYSDITELSDFLPADEEDYFAREDASKILEGVIEAVVGRRIGVHKLLVWLLLIAASANNGAKNSVIIAAIVKKYGAEPLNKLYKGVQHQFTLHPYLYLASGTKATIALALSAPDGDKTVGETRLEEYFGRSEGKYVISDWIYKINLSVRRSFP